jgi:hypothetical protein
MESGLASLDEFTGLSSAGLDSYDILTLNFHAARGLPGTENSDLDAWLAKREEWAGRIKIEVCRHLYRFDRQSQHEPTEFSYGNSLGRFMCWHALQVLQEDCGVKYHPDRKFKPDFCKPPDIFVHGIMDDDGQGGTCASMPVVYVSVLRFLGLPVHLVETRGHAFCRWDDPNGTTIHWENPHLVLWIPPERFNIEGSGEGIAFYPDVHYTVWPERWRPIEFEKGDYLRSLTAKDALAGFLIERGEYYWELGNTVDALKSYHYARKLAPDNERYKWLHGKRSHECLKFEEADRAIEEQVRKSYEQQFIPGEHSPLCKCAKCQQPKVQRWQPNSHSPNCQCADCRTAREAAMQPIGMAGHPANCQCAACAHQRHLPHVRGHAAFGIPNQQPRHAIPSHTIPGLPGF